MLWSQEGLCTQQGGLWATSASSSSTYSSSSSCSPLALEEEPVILLDDDVCLLRPRPLFTQGIRSSPSTQQQESQRLVEGDSQWTAKEGSDGTEQCSTQAEAAAECPRILDGSQQRSISGLLSQTRGAQSGGGCFQKKVSVGSGCFALTGRHTHEEVAPRSASQNDGRTEGSQVSGRTALSVLRSSSSSSLFSSLPWACTAPSRSLKDEGAKETAPWTSSRVQSDARSSTVDRPRSADQEPHGTPWAGSSHIHRRETSTSAGIPSASQQNCAWGLPPTSPWHRSPYVRQRNASGSPRKIFCCPEKEQVEGRAAAERLAEEERREEARHGEQREDREEEQAIMKHFDKSIFSSQTSEEGDVQEEGAGLEEEEDQQCAGITPGRGRTCGRGGVLRVAGPSELSGPEEEGEEDGQMPVMAEVPFRKARSQDEWKRQENGGSARADGRDKEETEAMPSGGRSASEPCPVKQAHSSFLASASSEPSREVFCFPLRLPRSARSQASSSCLSSRCTARANVLNTGTDVAANACAARARDPSTKVARVSVPGPAPSERPRASASPVFSSSTSSAPQSTSSSADPLCAVSSISSSHTSTVSSSGLRVSASSSVLFPVSCTSSRHAPPGPESSSEHNLRPSHDGISPQTDTGRQAAGGGGRRAVTLREEDMLLFDAEEEPGDEEEDEEDRKTEKADDEDEGKPPRLSSPSSRPSPRSGRAPPQFVGEGEGGAARRKSSEAEIEDLDELINVDVDYLLCSTQTPSSSSVASSCPSFSSSSHSFSSARGPSSASPGEAMANLSPSYRQQTCRVIRTGRGGGGGAGGSSSLSLPSSSSSVRRPPPSPALGRSRNLTSTTEKDCQPNQNLSCEDARQGETDLSVREDVIHLAPRTPCSVRRTEMLPRRPPSPSWSNKVESGGGQTWERAAFPREEAGSSYDRIAPGGTPPFKRQTLTQNSPSSFRRSGAPTVSSPSIPRSLPVSPGPLQYVSFASTGRGVPPLKATASETSGSGGACPWDAALQDPPPQSQTREGWVSRTPSKTPSASQVSTSCPHRASPACRVLIPSGRSGPHEKACKDSFACSTEAPPPRVENQTDHRHLQRQPSEPDRPPGQQQQQQQRTTATGCRSQTGALEFSPDEEAFLQMMDEGHF